MNVRTKVSGSRGLALSGLCSLVLLAGCARSPTFNVLGSYFPGWIACLAIGILVTVCVRLVLYRLQWEARIAALPLFYLCLALAAACAIWLIAFE